MFLWPHMHANTRRLHNTLCHSQSKDLKSTTACCEASALSTNMWILTISPKTLKVDKKLNSTAKANNVWINVCEVLISPRNQLFGGALQEAQKTQPSRPCSPQCGWSARFWLYKHALTGWLRYPPGWLGFQSSFAESISTPGSFQKGKKLLDPSPPVHTCPVLSDVNALRRAIDRAWIVGLAGSNCIGSQRESDLEALSWSASSL